MKRKYHFISGLPRSGSTLLSSILNQNPRFNASITDSLISYVRSIIINTDAGSGIKSLCPEDKQRIMMRGLVENYYYDGNDVCFNTNRAWAAYTPLVRDLFPESKMVLCIREVPWILDSFEQLHAKTPYDLKAIYGNQDLPTVYQRTNSLIDMNLGLNPLVGLSLQNTKQALFSNEKDMLCVIEYNALTKNPLGTIKKLYEFLDEPWFEHDFNDVEASYDEYDRALNMHGLHKVRKTVSYIPRKPILPQDLFERWSSESFWLKDFDHIKRQVTWISE
jgi:sulfotransferase